MVTKIRNFCIIAHIDHGKSTLADRFLEITDTVPERKMKAQYLDQMELEREKGITIKLQPVRMNYQSFVLNLIDTPGHVDFTYEVSRSLQAVEGAILMVDATQGIEAQTVSNLYLALEQNLKIIPVINKIDLANADIKKVSQEIMNILSVGEDEISLVSAKNGQGVAKVIDRVIKEIPPPENQDQKPLKALVFDSLYDEYKGIVAFIRIFEGKILKGDKIKLISSHKQSEALELGIFNPEFKPKDLLEAGEIGYVITGFKDLSSIQVGETITRLFDRAEAMPGYRRIKPMVFAGVFPKQASDFSKLEKAVKKIKLNDAAITLEKENFPVLGFGFRLGFLGLLHLEIFQERLRREYDLEIVITTPSVAYQVKTSQHKILTVNSPQSMPNPKSVSETLEPWMKVDIFTPKKYLGGIMELCQEKRGRYLNTEYLDKERLVLHYEMPLASIIYDFYDKLKSVSQGYASLNYDFLNYQAVEIGVLHILVAHEPIESLKSFIVKKESYPEARRIVDTLSKTIPRQLFEVKIQAMYEGKIIASQRIPALRKDVTAKLYGGDVTRKKKLLEKQKKGKKRLKTRGKVEIPPEAYLSILRK